MSAHPADPSLVPPQPGAQPAALNVPARADAVELIGEMQGSGYRTPPALVRRSDGQVLQLTPLLYLLLQCVDGRRDTSEIAAAVGAAMDRNITAADIQTLIDKHLLPLGLLRLADGSQPDLKKSDPLLRMRFRIAVTDPERTRRLTRPFRVLFAPFVVIPVLVAFVAVCWWVLMVEGLASATHEAFEQPGLLLLVFAVTLLSAGFHEFGHAAAAARAGAAPGTMGAGLYLVWPAFYTDVTDSYRLNRRGRLLTDVGGLYFNAIVAVAIVGVWWLTGFDALLLVVATQLIMMVRQLIPIVRFDGYHLLADATGVPDLFQRIRPTLVSLLPWRWNDPEARVLKPWARLVITLWVLAVIPLLLFMLVALVLAFPRLLGTAWHGVQEQVALAGERTQSGDVVAAAGHVVGIIAIAIPMAGLIYILVRLVRQVGHSVWKKTEGKPVRRVLAVIVAIAVAAALVFAWWPNSERYRPVQPYEGGTLAGAVTQFAPQSAGFREGQQGSTVALVQGGAELAGPEEPALALVLVPRDESVATAGDVPEAAPSWVFPFDRPEEATGQDTQALAVATEDGSVVYDVAFALVWADDNRVDTTNEAYAFASCTGCTAVAVSFQVVLIVGQADVVVPQNLSAAVNYECVECVAFALASQLVVSVDGALSEETRAALARLWEEIALFAGTIQDRPLSELTEALNSYKAKILEILEGASEEETTRVDPSPTAVPSPTPSGAQRAVPSPSAPGTGATRTPQPGAPSTPQPEDEESQPAPVEEPSPVPSSAPTPAPTSSPGT